MLSEGYYKHVEYKRRDPRTGKIITVKGGKTPGINVAVSKTHTTDDEHMSALHAALKQSKLTTEHSLQQHVHDHVVANYTGSEKLLANLKSQMLKELFDSGAVAVKDSKTVKTKRTKTKQAKASNFGPVQEKLDILGVDEKTLLRLLTPPGFDIHGFLSTDYFGGLKVSATILQKGKICGRFNRVFHCDRDRRRLDVVNDIFRLEKTAQNKGLGSLFTLHELDAVEQLSKRFKEPAQLSLTAVTMKSTITTISPKPRLVGAYVWPKVGFTVTKKSFQLLLQKVRLLPDADLTQSLTRADLVDLSKSRDMRSFLEHPKAKEFLTTIPCELDCETVLGSKDYKMLRKNLTTIIAKHSKAG